MLSDGQPAGRNAPPVTRLRPERLLSYIAASAASSRLSFSPGMLIAACCKEQNPKLAVTVSDSEELENGD